MARVPRSPSSSASKTETNPPQPKATGPWTRRGPGKRGRNAADDQADVLRAARRDRVADLRIHEGLSWRAIAKEVGLADHGQARDDFRRWVAEHPSPGADEVRSTQDQRLERQGQEILAVRRLLVQRLTKLGDDGKPAISDDLLLEVATAIAQMNREATRVSKSLRELHGADKPAKVEHSGPNGTPIPVAEAKTTLAELLALGEENAKP